MTVFLSLYMLVMRKTTFFRLNRVTFMTGTILCLILPFIKIEMPAETISVTPMTMIEDALTTKTVTLEAAVIGEDNGINWGKMIVCITFLGGCLVSLTVTAISYLRMRRLIRSVKPEKAGDTEVRIVDAEIPSFSWGRHIVISRKDLMENPSILTHEKMHVQCRHSLDLMAYIPATVIQWYNPLVWIARTELKMLHEYEADELTINKGIDATQYQLLLVKKAVGAKRFQLANGFNHSKLKNRITMMHKNKTNKWMRLAYFLCIPALIVAMGACAQKTNAGNISNPDALSIAGDKASTDTLQSEVVPFQFADIKPSFNGGDANKFSKWVNENLNYPENCKKEGICGRVTLTFTVTETGKVTDVKVLRGVHEDLDKEALRVVSSSPDWTPGMKDGKPVAITYTFPIIFQTKKPDTEAVPFQSVETKPSFNGGDANEFSKWVNENLNYPENCKKEGICGRVTLTFTVTETGKVTDVKVLRGVHEDLDKEALRVVSSSPDWTPGMKNGKPVPITFTFPVIFQTKKPEKDAQ